ncbi:collagen-like triple helix repeat-containing protein [Streptomyces sp. NPDC004324]
MPGEPGVPPGASEATRLLCAGTYLDAGYRDAVIEELYVHEERLAAPSLGHDAARVLAHALRARRIELGWAALILGLWVVGLPLSGYLLIALLFPCLSLAAAAWIRGSQERPPWYRRFPAWWVRWTGRLLMVYASVTTVRAAFGSVDQQELYEFFDLILPTPLVTALFENGGVHIRPVNAWCALLVLALVAVCVALQRGQFARALAHELHPARFGDMAADPAELAEGRRFQRLRQRIRVEQHSPLVMYHAAHPFCGAGRAYDTWSLAVELRPDPAREAPPLPINNRVILDRIHELLARLRLPSPHAGGAVRDRLRRLEIDECVFLPVAGLPRRDLAPYHQDAFVAHSAESVEEGGETRRHFLRVRVGGWEEEVVTTVFVRVHTQGGMLMLEIAPHVLLPVRADFENADRVAHQHRHNSPLGKAVWALARTPRSAPLAVATVARGAALSWRILTAGYGAAMPDGPARSVRELGSGEAVSLFQDMDVARYLKSVQDRVAQGVRQVLKDSGYRTDEFAQKVVNVSGGSTLIENARGAFAVGDNNVVTNRAPDPAGPSGTPGPAGAPGPSGAPGTPDASNTPNTPSTPSTPSTSNGAGGDGNG